MIRSARVLLSFVFSFHLLVAATALSQDIAWRQTNGPFGGSVTTIVFGQPGEVYIGTPSNGIFRSSDNGVNWAATGMPRGSVVSMRSYGDGVILAGVDQTLFRSSDHGTTWEAIGQFQSPVWDVGVDSHSHIFVGGNGIFRSTNDGASWARVDSGSWGRFAITSSDEIVAQFNRSYDDGNTWVVNDSMPLNVYGMAVAPDGVLYACEAAGVWRSSDGGNIWREYHLPGDPYIGDLAVNAGNEIFAAAYDGNGVFRSIDGGATWTQTATGIQNTAIGAVAVDAAGNIFAGSGGNGIYRSTDDGISWTNYLNGFINTRVSVFAMSTRGYLIAGTDGTGIFRSSDRGETWESANHGLPDYASTPINPNPGPGPGPGDTSHTHDSLVKPPKKPGQPGQSTMGVEPLRGCQVYGIVAAANGDLFITASQLRTGSSGYLSVGGIYRSTNDGADWAPTGFMKYGVSELSIDTVSGTLYTRYDYGIYSSTDNGDTWELTGLFALPQLFLPNGVLYSYRSPALYRSNDSGHTWTALLQPHANQSNTISSYCFDKSGNLFAAMRRYWWWDMPEENGVYRSTDGGASWTQVNNGLTDPNIAVITCRADGNLFAAGNNHAFVSSDHGDTWVACGSGIEDQGITTAIATADNGLYLGTWGGGVYREGDLVPIIDLPQNAIDLGPVEIGNSGGGSLTIGNSGTGKLIISSITSSSEDVTLPQGSITIPSGQSRTIPLTFAPLEEGAKSGSLTIVHDGISDVVSFAGTATNPNGYDFVVRTTPGAGWRMLSMPVDRTSPMALNGFYQFGSTSYNPVSTMTSGPGYWKRLNAITVNFVGFKRTTQSVSVTEGWNLVGSISDPIAVTDLVTEPAGILSPHLFTYNGGGYSIVTTVEPGRGYWVKAYQDGVIDFRSAGTMPRLSSPGTEPAADGKLTFTGANGQRGTLYVSRSSSADRALLSAYELPPLPPDGVFDVRFASGRSYEAIGGKGSELPIHVSSGSYPISVQYQSFGQGVDLGLKIGNRLSLLDDGKQVTIGDDESAIRLVSEYRELPSTFALLGNYPNPFNPSTTIRYDLPVASHVSLKVYNLIGQVVATLAEGEEEAGFRQVEWNASSMSSGIYFVRMDATGSADASRTFSSVQKMILMR